MQEKLDNLCEQVNYFKDQPEVATDKYGCHLCEQHKQLQSNFVVDTAIKASNADDMCKYKWPPATDAEPEERRMSDLSDWAPSVTSSVDIQLNALAIEQDIYNLRRECEEKDAKIKDLSAFIQTSESFGSKRIAELEDIIRRKNMIITKLKKDMLILEQKVPPQMTGNFLSWQIIWSMIWIAQLARHHQIQIVAPQINLKFQYLKGQTSILQVVRIL